MLINKCRLLVYVNKDRSINPFTPKSAKLKTEENKQRHINVLLSSFHVNGHTLGFHPQT